MKDLALRHVARLAMLLGVMVAPAVCAQSATTYIYTDSQGTPMAEADTQGQVVREFDYAPYGMQVRGAPASGPGYTSHVADPETQLVYMQQRYYDPGAARFLTVDPVTGLDGKDWRHFGRYAYAYDNPYRFDDPDGRCPMCIGFLIGAGLDAAIQITANMASGQSFGDAVSNVNMTQVAISGALGAVGQVGGSAAARTVVSGLSNGAKGKLGEGVARLGIALRGEKVIAAGTKAGDVAELGSITGRAAKSIPDFVVKTKEGAVKVVEAKFGTSRLTGAQTALKNQMGDAFTVSRTTVNEVANAGGAASAVVGGVTGAVIPPKDP